MCKNCRYRSACPSWTASLQRSRGRTAWRLFFSCFLVLQLNWLWKCDFFNFDEKKKCPKLKKQNPKVCVLLRLIHHLVQNVQAVLTLGRCGPRGRWFAHTRVEVVLQIRDCVILPFRVQGQESVATLQKLCLHNIRAGVVPLLFFFFFEPFVLRILILVVCF